MKTITFRWLKSVFYIIGAVLASLVLYTLLAQAGPGNVVTVNSTDVDIVDNGNCTLPEAVQATNTGLAVDSCLASGTFINFDASTNGIAIVLTDELLITSAVGIQGNGQGLTIIDGGDSNRIFRMGDPTLAEVTLYTMTLQNASGVNGGAVYAEDIDTFTMSNVEFLNNSAESGAAIYGTGGTITVVESTFTGNEAVDGSGGAIYTNGGTVDVTDSSFTGNSSSGAAAGAIYGGSDAELIIDGSSFDNNDAGYGGAIVLNDNLGTLSVSNSSFTGNTATNESGAISSYGDTNITDSNFESNSATGENSGGGAMYHSDTILTIRDTTFESNTVGENGGALNLYDNDTTLTRVTFRSNTAVEDGGAIYNGSYDLIIIDSSFSSNEADDGGAIFTEYEFTATGSTFNGNTAADGGAIYNWSEIDVENSTFSANSASNAGGAIYGDASNPSTFTHLTFTGNTAVDGADVYIPAGKGSSTFAATIFNSAYACGGDAITSGDDNVENGNTCGLAEANDLVNTDPQLGSLTDNGGLTLTHDISNSSLFNTISVCGLGVDQAGTSRPTNGACEPGALEHINIAPVAVNDSASTPVDTFTNINIMNNDSDADGSLNVVTGVTIVSGPTLGSVGVDEGGNLDYTPNAGVSGEDKITYTVEDDLGATSNIATVTITVGSNNSHNDAPVANDDTASTNFETAVLIDVIANDTDVDGSLDASTVAITSYASNGTTSVDLITGEVTYTPDLGFAGDDSFAYLVWDNENTNSNIATVIITVAEDGGVVIAEEPGSGTGEVVIAEESPCAFTDIAGHRYEDAIVALCGAGIIEGYRDEAGALTGLVGVDNQLNRAESQTIITRSVFGEPAVGNYKNCFPDVNEEWFAVYVCYAKDFLGLTGYLAGDDAGFMRPDRTVSFEELTKMLITSNEVELAALVSGDEWYQVYLDTAEDLGALEGLSLNVGQALTRGQSFQLMYNVLNSLGMI